MTYIKRKSQKQEKRTAEEFGGRTQIASGAIEGMKGDVRTGDTSIGFKEDDFLIENKFTDSDKYKLDLKTWQKVEQEALRDNMRTPLMQIDIKDISLVVIGYNDFLAMGLDKHFLEPHDSKYIQAKSFQMKYDFYQSNLELFGDFMQKLFFDSSKTNLVVIGKDDFTRFL